MESRTREMYYNLIVRKKYLIYRLLKNDSNLPEKWPAFVIFVVYKHIFIDS